MRHTFDYDGLEAAHAAHCKLNPPTHVGARRAGGRPGAAYANSPTRCTPLFERRVLALTIMVSWARRVHIRGVWVLPCSTRCSRRVLSCYWSATIKRRTKGAADSAAADRYCLTATAAAAALCWHCFSKGACCSAPATVPAGPSNAPPSSKQGQGSFVAGYPTAAPHNSGYLPSGQSQTSGYSPPQQHQSQNYPPQQTQVPQQQYPPPQYAHASSGYMHPAHSGPYAAPQPAHSYPGAYPSSYGAAPPPMASHGSYPGDYPGYPPPVAAMPPQQYGQQQQYGYQQQQQYGACLACFVPRAGRGAWPLPLCQPAAATAPAASPC